jgi:hypothetical protein
MYVCMYVVCMYCMYVVYVCMYVCMYVVYVCVCLQECFASLRDENGSGVEIFRGKQTISVTVHEPELDIHTYIHTYIHIDLFFLCVCMYV